MSEQNVQTTTFYRWNGDACRVHEDKDGTLTADVYRAGRGTLPVSATDILYGSVEISEKQYKELVREEIAISKKMLEE